MYPFRLGTTSYILPADILPNVQMLATRVQDVELVLFEVDAGPNNLPTPAVIEALGLLAEQHALTYTVHLPLDLRLGEAGTETSDSLSKARRVIERTAALDPWAYVLHLDGRAVRELPPADARWLTWRDQSLRALELAAGWAGRPELLAVENLEHYPPDFIEPIFARMPVSRCVDVGHLWLDGRAPLPYLQRAAPRLRVVHLHGLGERDHQALALMSPAQLDPVTGWLLKNFTGVLTLEVFNETDFYASQTALSASAARWKAEETL